MATSTIPVDLRNPGQVFACLGLMETAEALGLGEVEGGFDYTKAETQTTFTLSVEGEAEPVRALVSFLIGAKVSAVGHRGSLPYKASWRLPVTSLDELIAAAPAPAPDKSGERKLNPTLPGRLESVSIVMRPVRAGGRAA